MALTKFRAPVAWMLEAAIVLELALAKYVEAAISAGTLAFKAALGFFQEGRAQATLAALKSRLASNAAVGVLPEGKYNLVKTFQHSGHTVGMCGDGANDAPALRQAQMDGDRRFRIDPERCGGCRGPGPESGGDAGDSDEFPDRAMIAAMPRTA